MKIYGSLYVSEEETVVCYIIRTIHRAALLKCRVFLLKYKGVLLTYRVFLWNYRASVREEGSLYVQFMYDS